MIKRIQTVFDSNIVPIKSRDETINLIPRKWRM